MVVEVERKFLVNNDGWREAVSNCQHLRQGYLATSQNCLVRVRCSHTDGWVTIKGPSVINQHGALERLEYEWKVGFEQAVQMIDNCAYATVEKTRYDLNYPLGQWTVDVFSGANSGLVLLEIEGETIGRLTAEDLPNWVGREVSDDPKYANAYLAQCPYGSWAVGSDLSD